MTDIWRFTQERLNNGQRVMLIIVTEVKGSSPGKKGFKMAVSTDGQLFGSIGGGVMEYNMVELARQRLESHTTDAFLKRQVHASDAGEDASGLICAGEQTHAFAPIDATDLPRIDSLIHLTAEGESPLLVIDASGLQIYSDDAKPAASSVETEHAGSWFYSEEIKPADTLYIFGGGHISIPLSQVCRMIGLRVIVLDDREDLNTMDGNKWAHEKKVIDYKDAAQHISHPAASYVCIMTVSHASDQQILEQMISLPLKYLGMIGSKNKVRKIFGNILDKGILEDTLQYIDAPMGLSINSESPEEIAVSIAARIIMEKNRSSQR
jgi:xanthine dehydrogenase accessory factor